MHSSVTSVLFHLSYFYVLHFTAKLSTTKKKKEKKKKKRGKTQETKSSKFFKTNGKILLAQCVWERISCQIFTYLSCLAY